MSLTHRVEHSVRWPVIRSGKPAEVIHIRERGGRFYRVDTRSFLERLVSSIRGEASMGM